MRRIESGADVATAADALADGSRRERILAARALAESAPDDPRGVAGRALAAAAGDPDPWVRRWTMAALANRGLDPAVAVPALARALGDGCAPVRAAAALALGRLEGAAASAVPALMRVVEEDLGTPGQLAAWALGNSGKAGRPARPLLERLGYDAAARRLAICLPVVSEAPEWRIEMDECMIVSVDSEGTIEVKDCRFDLRELASYLCVRADTSRDEVPPYTSKIHVHLALDEDLPGPPRRPSSRCWPIPEWSSTG